MGEIKFFESEIKKIVKSWPKNHTRKKDNALNNLKQEVKNAKNKESVKGLALMYSLLNNK